MKKGADKITLIVNVDQKDAVHVYEKIGFKIVKTLKGEKMGDGNVHYGYLMAKDLVFIFHMDDYKKRMTFWKGMSVYRHQIPPFSYLV